VTPITLDRSCKLLLFNETRDSKSGCDLDTVLLWFCRAVWAARQRERDAAFFWEVDRGRRKAEARGLHRLR
jgi:hypothetical protein